MTCGCYGKGDIGLGLTDCSHGFDHVVFFLCFFDEGEEDEFRGKRRIFLVNGRAMRDEEDLVVFLTNVCVVQYPMHLFHSPRMEEKSNRCVSPGLLLVHKNSTIALIQT